MTPTPESYEGEEHRHRDHGRRISDLEKHYERMNGHVDQTYEFRRKVERALFDEDGKSRIALMEVHMKGLLQFLDRGKFITYLLWTGWIGLGGIIGAIIS